MALWPFRHERPGRDPMQNVNADLSGHTIQFDSRGLDLRAGVAGSGPVLVYCHGLSATHRSVLASLEQLAGSYTILAPDALGHGGSWCTEPSYFSWRGYAEDLVALLDHLGVDQAYVGGTSFGSGIAILAALNHQDRFRGAILTSPVFMGDRDGWTSRQAKVKERRRTSVLPELDVGAVAKAADLFAEASGGADDVKSATKAWLRETWTQHDPASFAVFMRTYCSDDFGHPFEDISELENLVIPTLVVPGDDDIHPAEVAEAYRSTLPNVDFAGYSIASVAADVNKMYLVPELLSGAIRVFLDRIELTSK